MTHLTLVRCIAARPTIVFEALTTATGLASWFGPDDGPVLLAEADARIGGRFRVRFRTRDGLSHECHGAFLEITPPTYLAMSWRWVGGVEDPGESRLEFRLRAIDIGVELTLTHSQLAGEPERQSHEDGWIGALAKLQARFTQPYSQAPERS